MTRSHHSSKSPLRFTVIQLGARMHYAVPTLLARSGMLQYFYTDIYASDALLRGIKLLPQLHHSKIIKRLMGRAIPGEVPRSRIVTFSTWAMTEYGLGMIRHKGIPLPTTPSVEQQIHRSVAQHALLNSNALYTLINSDLEVVRQAKQQGLLVVHEQILNPNVGHILREERDRYPAIERQDSPECIELGIQRDQEQWSLADLILSPSEFVSSEIVNMGGKAERIALVPYGLPEDWLTYQPNPQAGRVLFVGSVGLRKGNHYLAEATRILRKRGVKCQVRVVGPYDSKAIQRPEFQGPTYIGQVPRAQVQQEFLQADIFVLPTLSDSFALVHLEAMACGLPVITTPNCGSVVRDNIDGFIVPIRNAEMLADRIEQLILDVNLRRQMSYNARERAKEFTWEKYEDRLLTALKSLEARVR